MFFNTSAIGRSEGTGARRRRNVKRGEWAQAPGRRCYQAAPKVSVIIYRLIHFLTWWTFSSTNIICSGLFPTGRSASQVRRVRSYPPCRAERHGHVPVVSPARRQWQHSSWHPVLSGTSYIPPGGAGQSSSLDGALVSSPPPPTTSVYSGRCLSDNSKRYVQCLFSVVN